jgi:hypothetical protein
MATSYGSMDSPQNLKAEDPLLSDYDDKIPLLEDSPFLKIPDLLKEEVF